MEQPQTVANDYIQATVSGPVTGQVAVGKYILQVGDVHGGVVNINLPDQKPRLRARPTPVSVLPRRFAGLLDRTDEVSVASQALAADMPVEFYAEGGAGKTTLLRVLARHSIASAYPAGVIYLSARDQSPADLLQSIFDALFEYDAPYKPSEGEVRLALQGKRGLILLDDVSLNREELEYLFDAAPDCTFLLASPDRKLWVEGYSSALPGLPLQEARSLLERQLDRSLEHKERDSADRLITALRGNPLAILQAGALVREGSHTLQELAESGRDSRPERKIAAFWLGQLTKSERGVVAAIAALNGVPLRVAHLAGMTRLPDPRTELEGLQKRGLVQLSGNGFILGGGFARFVQESGGLDAWRELAARHFRAWGQARLGDPRQILEEAGAILRLASMLKESGSWKEALELVRVVEGALAVGRRWGAWENALRLGLEAAESLGDLRAKAWAMHQLGTRALCLGENLAARRDLVRALRLRQTLGDRAGAAVTRHNLNLLLGPPGNGGNSSPKNPLQPRFPVHMQAVFILSALVVSGVLLVMAVLAVIHVPFAPISTPQSNSFVPTSTNFSPSPTHTATVEIKIPDTGGATAPSPTITFTPTNLLPTESATARNTETPEPSQIPCTPRYDWYVYTIRSGDTLWSIAQATGSSVSELMLANCLSSTRIDEGQPLLVPRLPPIPPTHTPTPTQTATLTPAPTTPAPEPPDLVIDTLAAGPAKLAGGEGPWLVYLTPYSLSVTNQGGELSGPFRIAVSIQGAQGEGGYPEPPPNDLTLLNLDEPLAAGGSRVFSGDLTIFTLPAWDSVQIDAVADDCSGQENPVPCQVVESDEGNNRETQWVELPNQPPSVDILDFPEEGVTLYYYGYDEKGWYVDLALQGYAKDPEEGQLAGDSLAWASSLQGDLDTGEALDARLYGPCSGATHAITLAATDARGASGVATRQVRLENEGSCDPKIYIKSPMGGMYGVDPENFELDPDGRKVYSVKFDGVATAFDVLDREITDSLEWRVEETGAAGIGGSFAFTLSLTDQNPKACESADYTLRIKAADAEGDSAEETISITLAECPPGGG